MTVSYTSKVSKAGLGSFVRVLFLWKGSIYKLVYKELLIFVVLYYTINIFYRFLMNDFQRATFEQIVLYCDTFVNLIPLPFVLGFFVSLIVGRWWSQFQAIPFPDELMVFVNSLLLGKDEKSRLIRRTLMRYLNLSSLLIFRSISSPVKRRFPDMDSLVEAGFMTYKELKIYENIATPHSKWWIPCVWFANLITRAHNEKRLVDEFSLRTILLALMDFRGKCSSLYAYDWISVPLVYTQVVTLANYMYFMANLMGRQLLDPAKRYSNRFDIYFPIFTFLQFLFYMGWLKVAEQLMNPFGEDEDDFEVNWIIDRNFQISMLTVDDLHNTFPDLEKDIYWDELEPDIPYTEASKYYKKNSWMGSTADLHLTRDDVNEIHKDWISAENLKNLNPFSNFHDTLHRLSSTSSLVRSRKSNRSIKSDTPDAETPFKSPATHDDDYFNTNHQPTYRSSFSHVPRFGSHSLLSPIREQRFEVTRISDDNNVIDSNTFSGLHNGMNEKSTSPNGQLKQSPVSNDFQLPDLERRKKISSSDNRSTITENDLSVKGNIGNLAKFHNRKIREKMLKSAAGYVSEDFGNADTPYAKRPLGQSKSHPARNGQLVTDLSSWANQGVALPGASANTSRSLGRRILRLDVSGTGALFKRKKKVSSSKEAGPHIWIQGMSPKRAPYDSSRKLKRLSNGCSIGSSQPLPTTYIPSQMESYNWNRNTSLKRSSLSSELKSWIFPPHYNATSSPDKAFLMEGDISGYSASLRPLTKTTYDGPPYLKSPPDKGLSNILTKSTDQILKSTSSSLDSKRSPKFGLYRRHLSLPQGKLLEEDESDTNTTGLTSNETTLLTSGNKSYGGGNTRGNVKDLFSPGQQGASNNFESSNKSCIESSSVRDISPSKVITPITQNYDSPNKMNDSKYSSTHSKSGEDKSCSFVEITLV